MSSKQGKRASAPKFSSFKAKSEPAQAQAQTDSPSGEAAVKQPDSSNAADRQPPRHSSRRPSPAASDSRRGASRSANRRPSPERSPALWVTDRKGDSLIRRYGTNNRHDVPAYLRFGSGRVLGVDGFMRVDRSGNRDEFYMRGFQDSRSLLSSDKKTLLAKGVRLRAKPVRVRQSVAEASSATEDYVSLGSSKLKRRRDSEGHDSARSADEDGPSYRSIHGKSKPHAHSDSDEIYDSDVPGDGSAADAQDPLTARSIELSRRTREHPEDIDAWLAQVEHQNKLLAATSSDGRRPTAAEVKSYADIKLSLLEKAMAQVTDGQQRREVHLRVMKEGAKVWDPSSLEKRWNEFMGKSGSSLAVWKAYMNYRQTTISSMKYDAIKQLYMDKLRDLTNCIWSDSTTTDASLLVDQVIYVFLRATRFVADAGFGEVAAAAWQAALECTFCRPPLQPSPGGSVPGEFQDFWESEVPRIGEPQAKGWAAYHADPGAQEAPEPKAASNPPLPETRDGYKAWSAVENFRARQAAVPARTLDEGTDDDPFRVIMFADIQDLILYLPPSALVTAREQLIDAFLIFCRLPPAFRTRSIVEEMLGDEFVIRSTQAPLARGVDERGQATGELEPEQQQRSPDLFFEFQTLAQTPDVLFPLPDWFRYIHPLKEDTSPEWYSWVSSSLRQLVRSFGQTRLGPYYLAFEASNEPGNERKTAKALLKKDGTNAALYQGFAMAEWARGDESSGRNVLSAAMGLSVISDHERSRLGVCWAWLELAAKQHPQSISRLCSLAEENPASVVTMGASEISPAQLLKARQFFLSSRDYLLSSGDATNSVVYAEGLALLEYLTQSNNKEPCSGGQGDIWAALNSISTFSEDLISRRFGHHSAHEGLLQAGARLLYYHACSGPFRHGLLREQLTRYIKLFPHNVMFLSLFAWKETRLSIEDRVRGVLSESMPEGGSDSMGRHIFAIRHELRAGNAHSARAAFERALEGEEGGGGGGAGCCAHHPGLWVAYVRFCCQARGGGKGGALRGRVKEVFYRAVQRCPWSKEVLMEAFGTLGRDLDSAELRSVYATLSDDLGLRVHVEMPAFVEGWRGEARTRAK